MNAPTPVTADQLLQMPDDGYRYELVGGELRKKPWRGWREGVLVSQLFMALRQFADEQDLGLVLGPGVGFRLACDPDTVRVADTVFLGKERLVTAPAGNTFWPGAPDLVVEVVSPGDTMGEVDEKVRMWIDAGTAMVWVVNPKWRNVTVYRSPTDIKTLTENDELDGEDVVPGFRCRVESVFVNT